MKTKTIFSFLVLLVFAFLGGGSIEEDGKISSWVWVIVAGIVIFGIVGAIAQNAELEKSKRQQEQDRLRSEERLKAQREEYIALRQQFIAANGTPDKSLATKNLDLSSEIHVYEKEKKVFIFGKEYSFKDVISCTFSDSPRVIKGKVTAITKSKNGNVIGRSIVGDVVAGPAGAIIGGTTAKKHTEYIQEDDRTIHDYTVIINMNSISDPIIRIYTGEDGTLTNEIVGLMNVIISRK